MLTALIMAGGKGTRFWPLSTEKKPKQFLNLIGEETMIQMTVNRIKPIIPIERIFVCTGQMYVDLVKEQLPDLPLKNIIVEPEGRNTTPCITLSALVMKRYYNDANMIVLPSDHLIGDEDEFRSIVNAANDFIERNDEAMITLGINPTRAETGYGYIKYTDDIQKSNGHRVIKVDKFVEKPDEETAKGYLRDGSYLWNGGMFVWSINNIINAIKKYSPDTYEAIHGIEEVEEDNLQQLINEKYQGTESISIDYAVLEKAQDIYVIPSNIAWDDIGSWRAIERYREKDENDNILNENARAVESESSMIINSDKKVVMIGVKDIMTVETDDGIFVVNKDYMDNLKEYKNTI
ncbi:MAG: mannose-1-phosphate guanylyltransferase [Clostridium butyricum]|nr:mannose-1-phosphate guanylyltransferase [Clostridium butyricum]MDU5821075.1 mannose-1-phosphate guanylyltransferase [Clostridium butyricum]